MADSSKFCTICDQLHIFKQSTDWCSECEQALCAECKKFHSVSKLSRQHVTISIADYQALAPSISAFGCYCSDHEEKYQMFCQTHDKFLCSQCIEQHSECKDVIPLSKLTMNVKTSEAFREAEQGLQDNDENIVKIEETIKDLLRIFKDQKENILSEISKVRSKINEHLDKIEKILCKNVSDMEHTASKELESSLIALKDKKEENLASKEQLANMRKHASDLQTFLGLRHISSVATTTEKYIKSIIDTGILNRITLELSFNETLRNIPNEIHVFGSVSVKKGPCDLKMVKQKEKQAQLVGAQSTSIQDIKLELTQTISTQISYTWGCAILPDGKLVFCNHSGTICLVVTDANGKCLVKIPVQQGAFNVTCISDTTVAVTTTVGSSYGINLIDISSRKILKFIARGIPCHGITSVNGSLVYCVKGKGIEIMDINGENTTTIVRCNLPDLSYIASYNDKLYYTNPSVNTVTCCDMKGNTIWTFKDETVLRKPYGISVDNDGHVYVVSNGSKSVVVLSANGQQSRQILSKKDGLIAPTAIHIDRTRKQLLVANFLDTGLLFRFLS